MEPSSATLSLVGSVIADRYRINKLLGEGGMGAVFLAEHILMRKRVALKLLHADISNDHEILARFRREAQAAALISHPNVAAATNFGQAADGSFFLVLEYVEGKSLRKEIDARERLAPVRALHIARQVAIALEKAHAAGIIHRDLKPDNIMLVTKEGDPDFVKVLDFGIARIEPHAVTGAAAGALVTKMGTILGTPEYMSPEQALGETAGPGADIYSLGVMLYEMLSGEIPFDADDRGQILNMHITAAPPPMKGDIPPAIADLVTRCLVKDPKGRPADAVALRRDIEIAAGRSGIDLTFSQSSPVLARTSDPGGGSPAPPPSQRNWNANDGLAKTEYGLTSEPELGAQTAKTQAGGTGPGATTLGAMKLGPGIPGLHLGPLEKLPRPLALAALGVPFFVFAFLLVVVISLAAHHANGGASNEGGAPDAAKLRETHASATQLVAAKAAGVAALESLEKEYPADAAVEVELAKAYSEAGRDADAVRVVSKLDVAAIDDDVLDTVIAAARKPDAADEAFAALEGPLGTRGVDGLIALLADKAPVGTRAQKALRQKDIRGRASSAAAVFLDLKAARECKTFRDLLERARDQGDQRSLPLLRALKKDTGCGFFHKFDCYACLRKDDALDDAIANVERRAAAKP